MPRALHIVRPSVSQLPESSTPLVGRGVELERAASLLSKAGRVEVIGPPGVGKTRLAIEVARRRAGEWDEIFWVPLEHVDETFRIASYVARRLGIHATMMRYSDLVEALTDRGQRMLVVIDNAEHVADEARRLVRALSEVPDVGLIVTSRERIDARDVIELSGLPVADGLHLLEAFRDDPTATEELDALRAYVERVEGLPLALRLGASRLGVLSAEQLLEAQGGGEVWDAVRTSWERLDEDQRATMAALGAFKGGADAMTLGGVADLPEARLLPALAELRRRSLVEVADVNGRRRFSLLFAIAEFVASERDLAPYRDRHAEHFARWGSSVEETSRSMDDDSLTRRLAAERSNLASAAAWATANRDYETASAALLGLAAAAEISGFADDFYSLGKRLWEHRDDGRNERFLCAFGAMLGDSDRIKFAEDVFNYVLEATSSATAKIAALRGLARCEYRYAHFDRACELADQAVELARTTNDPYEVGVARRVWAAVRAVSSDSAGAAEALQEAAAGFRELGAFRDEAQCEYLLAWHYATREEPDQVLIAARRATEVATLLGDERMGLEVAWLLGGALFDRGDLDGARIVLEQLLEDSRRMGVLDSIRCTAETLVNLHVETDDLEAAAEAFRLQGRLANSAAEPVARFWYQQTLGELAAFDGDLAAAAEAMDEALARPIDYWNASLIVGANCYRSTVAFAMHDPELGEATLARAQHHAERDVPGLQLLYDVASAGRAIVAESHEEAGQAMEPIVRLANGTDGWIRRSAQARLHAKLVVAHLGPWRALYDRLVDLHEETLISGDGAWFRRPDGAWVSLRPRPRLAAMLAVLAHHEVADLELIQREVWPGEVITESSAANRIRATISMLRSEGLGELIQHVPTGYQLDRARCDVFGGP